MSAAVLSEEASVIQAPVLVLDSGVGGLSVHAHIRRRLPEVPTVYLADSAGFPYGIKTEAEVLQRVLTLVEAATEVYSPSLIVVACNTASTLVLPELRARLKIPVVGVVPAIKTAAALSSTRQIGLLATPGTVSREYTDQLIGSFASDCEIVRVGSHELVHIAEAHIRGVLPEQEKLRDILSPFFDQGRGVDAIVLGCTHFPLLTAELQQAAPRAVHWVDSGEAIARRVAFLLGRDPGADNLPVAAAVQADQASEVIHIALSTLAYDEAMLLGIRKFGFNTVELFS